MDENSNVVRLRQPDAVDDPLTEVLRAGARQLLAQAVELEVEALRQLAGTPAARHAGSALAVFREA